GGRGGGRTASHARRGARRAPDPRRPAPARVRPRDLAGGGAAHGAESPRRAGRDRLARGARPRDRAAPAREASPRVTGNGGPPSGRQTVAVDAPLLDGRSALGLAAVSGALLAVAFPIVDWGPVAWIALVPLLFAA